MITNRKSNNKILMNNLKTSTPACIAYNIKKNKELADVNSLTLSGNYAGFRE